jgi:hypothetical protein
MSSQRDEPVRKPYKSPRLETYGDIHEITESVSMMGMADGAAHGMTKTR